MGRKYLMLAAALLSLLLLPSCALIPQEEEVRTVPLVKEYVREEFSTVTVQRGNLVLTENVTCKYVPVQKVMLSFALGGEYVDKVFVSVGDTVEKGQLLAQLQLDDLELRITQTQQAIAELELKQSYLGKEYELALRRQEIAGEGLDPLSAAQALAAVHSQYEVQGRSIADALNLQYLTLATLEEDLAERQIFAPFAGTITDTQEFDEGERSVYGNGVVTLADATMSLFRAETKYWHLFQPGDEYEIVASKTPYAAVVTAESDLGLPEQEKVEGKKAYVYFVLKEPAFDLEDNQSGLIELVLDQRTDVLYVAKNAISGADGRPIVYYQREDGMKAYKYVETGLEVGKQVEIISGLEEGEHVIVD